MKWHLSSAISSLIDGAGNGLVPALSPLSIDLALIAFATIAAPPDPDGRGLTAATAGFLIAPRCSTPTNLGLALGFELESLGFIKIVQGDTHLAEFVPTRKLLALLPGVRPALARN